VDQAGIFGELRQFARESYDRIAGLVLEEIAVGGCIAKAPGAGNAPAAAPSTAGNWA
jgi:hypothetical protein